MTNGKGMAILLLLFMAILLAWRRVPLASRIVWEGKENVFKGKPNTTGCM